MNEDTGYMRKAVTLAKKGAGWVNPNPMVGAVVVKNGKIIASGYHEYFGGSHAEVNAFREATGPVEGATLYVTMEPCSFHGKTPACAPVVVKSGIRKVVIGMPDPNPMVAGNGIRILQEAGIEVVTGILEEEISVMNEAFTKYITTGRPFCTLKTAMTLDGKIATVTHESKWISGVRSRKRVHELRHQAAAIMTGVDSVINDDPLLNVRLKGRKSKDPLKVIPDSRCRIPVGAKVLQYNPQLTIIATTSLAPREKVKEIERLGVQVMVCPLKNGRVDLEFLAESLGIMGIDSILLEGGSTLACSALEAGIVDKMISFISPKIIGGKMAPTPVGGEGIPAMEDAIPVGEWKVSRSGEDFMIVGYIKHKSI